MRVDDDGTRLLRPGRGVVDVNRQLPFADSLVDHAERSFETGLEGGGRFLLLSNRSLDEKADQDGKASASCSHVDAVGVNRIALA